MRRHLAIGAMVIGVVLSGCTGDDDEATTTPAAPDAVEAPRESAPPPSAPGSLPPKFVECMADQGIDVEQFADIHSAQAQQALQACLQFLHS